MADDDGNAKVDAPAAAQPTTGENANADKQLAVEDLAVEDLAVEELVPSSGAPAVANASEIVQGASEPSVTDEPPSQPTAESPTPAEPDNFNEVPESLSTPHGAESKHRRSSSAKVAPWAEEPAVNLAASITTQGARTPEQLMHPSRYSSRFAPGVQRFAPVDPLCSWWGLGCISTAPQPLSSLDHRLAVTRAARTVWATHVATWLILLASLGDAALLTFTSGQSMTQLLEFTFSDWRLALLPQMVLVGSSLLSLLLTTPCISMRTSILISNPAYLEILCSVLIVAPPLVASYVLVTSEPNPPNLPRGHSYFDARALAYLAVGALAAHAALQQAALACASAGLLLGSGVAVAFTQWYSRGGALSVEVSATWPPDTWATPFFHSLCLLACFCIGGRVAYVRELWLRHEALLRDEMTRGAQHAARLLAELYTPFPRVPAFQNPRALKHLEAAAAPLSAREAARARADAATRAALHPQLGMAGGKSVVDSVDRESEPAVAEEATRAASMYISTAGPEAASKVEHVGIVCVRVHGCDSGSTRAGSIAEACEAMLALCEATAAKASDGWVCVESRGPMMILACGLYPPSPQDASPPTPREGQPPTSGETSHADETADAEAAALSCALGVKILQAAAAARSSADAAAAWANLGTSSLLPTSGHIEAQAAGEVSITMPPDRAGTPTDEAAASTPDRGVTRGDDESPEVSSALEAAQQARKQSSAGSALRKAVLTAGWLDGRFAHAPTEHTFMAWRGEEERRAASKSGKGLLCVLLLWGLHEALLIATGANGSADAGANAVWFPGKYALLAFCAFALALAFATLADIDRVWRRLMGLGLARPLCLAFYVGTIALVSEALLQRNSGELLRATPLFALLVPLCAYGGALPPTWSWLATLACYGVLQSASFVLSYAHTRTAMRGGYPTLLLAESALFVAVASALACWQCRVASEQQRLGFILAQSVCQQERRASTILRTALPAQVVEAMGLGPPLLFHPHASVIVARPVGLLELLRSDRVTEIAKRVAEAFEAAMELHGCTVVREVGDVLIGVCGAPKPMERHAERACHAATAAIQAVSAIAKDGGVPIALRVGVHTSRLVSGALGSTRGAYSLWGDAATHADRLQRLAPLDGALVSAQTLEAAMCSSALHKRSDGSKRQLAFASHGDDAESYVLAVND